MALEIRLSHAAARRFVRLPRDLQARLMRKINEIAENPTLKGSAPLQGFPDLHRVRVGGWRVIYSWSSSTLSIEEIASRGQVYKDLMR